MKKNNLSGIGIIVIVWLFIYICFYTTSNNNSSLPTEIKPSPTVYKPPLPTKTKLVVLTGCVNSSSIRIRENPGTEFEVIGGLSSGTCFTIIGRNQDASWAFIETQEYSKGWVAAWLITVQGNLNSVAITSNIVSFTPTANFVENQSPSSNNEVDNNEKGNCLSAYPSVCIPPGRDLDCSDISYRNFPVPGSDPFNFDLDGDGIGCE